MNNTEIFNHAQYHAAAMCLLLKNHGAGAALWYGKLHDIDFQTSIEILSETWGAAGMEYSHPAINVLNTLKNISSNLKHLQNGTHK